jgi:hypothetical protein
MQSAPNVPGSEARMSRLAGTCTRIYNVNFTQAHKYLAQKQRVEYDGSKTARLNVRRQLTGIVLHKFGGETNCVLEERR